MDHTYKTLEEKFSQLPESIQEALTSTDVAKHIKVIGNEHGLRIDQVSVLYDLTAHVMLGLTPSSDFIKTLSKEAGVTDEVSQSIANDINKNIFSEIRSSVQNIQQREREVAEETSNVNTNSSLERAGDFSIVKDEHGHDGGEIQHQSGSIMIPERHKILSRIEDREPIPASKAPQQYESNHTDPLVDHLLSQPEAVPEVKVVNQQPPEPVAPQMQQTVVPQPVAQQTPPPVAPQPPKPIAPKHSGPDPYREATK